MSRGRRQPPQAPLFIPAMAIAQGPGTPYTKLNQVLAAAGFDAFVEDLCAPYYKEGGRPGIPPGVYFRMVLIGYFEVAVFLLLHIVLVWRFVNFRWAG